MRDTFSLRLCDYEGNNRSNQFILKPAENNRCSALVPALSSQEVVALGQTLILLKPKPLLLLLLQSHSPPCHHCHNNHKDHCLSCHCCFFTSTVWKYFESHYFTSGLSFLGRIYQSLSSLVAQMFTSCCSIRSPLSIELLHPISKSLLK